jgi:PAS domain-containing protein
MIKSIKENVSFIKIASLFFILFFSAGIFLTYSYQKEQFKQINEYQFNKIKYLENLYRSKKARLNYALSVSERIINEFIVDNTLLNFNYNDSLTVKVFSDVGSHALYFDIPLIQFSDMNEPSFNRYLNKLAYISNSELSFWIRVKKGFVKTASSEINDNSVGYLNENQELINEIESGKKISQIEINDYGSKLFRYIPYFFKGSLIGFFRIVILDSYVNSSNIGILNEKAFIFMLNNDGTPYFESFSEQKPSDIEIIYRDILNKKGRDKSFNTKEYTVFYSYFPKDMLTFGIIFKTQILKNEIFNHNLKIWITLALILMASLIISFLYLNKEKIKQRNFSRKLLNILSINDKQALKNELSVYNFINDYIIDINNYVKELRASNYNVKFSFIGDQDTLRNNLTGIHQKLMEKTNLDLEMEKENEFQRNLNKGSTEIIEVLQYFSDLNDLSFRIIKSIADFLKFEQGALFILIEKPDTEPILQMMASYAYGKQRFSQKMIPINEGLLGRAYLEKESIHMTELPPDYNFIESGFGEQPPESLLIVPLIFNNKVQAIIELSSIASIENYKIEFIEKIGENIASTIANIKHTLQTEELLEKTRIQSLEIEDQRKTLEEKINTHRKQNRNLDKELLQLIEIIESVKSITYMIEYDLDGIIVDVSTKTMELLHAKKQDLLMMQHIKLIHDPDYQNTYKEFWNDLLKNKSQSLVETIIFNEKEYKLLQNYVPIRNVKRKIYRFLSVGTLIKN